MDSRDASQEVTNRKLTAARGLRPAAFNFGRVRGDLVPTSCNRQIGSYSLIHGKGDSKTTMLLLTPHGTFVLKETAFWRPQHVLILFPLGLPFKVSIERGTNRLAEAVQQELRHLVQAGSWVSGHPHSQEPMGAGKESNSALPFGSDIWSQMAFLSSFSCQQLPFHFLQKTFLGTPATERNDTWLFAHREGMRVVLVVVVSGLHITWKGCLQPRRQQKWHGSRRQRLLARICCV